MEFEWDEAKNQANVRKHGVTFETASRIFETPVLTLRDRRKDYGEARYVSIGQLRGGALVVVAHTDRAGRTRLISARPASRRERQVYYEKIS